MPCFPPLALLLTAALENARRRDPEKFRSRCRWLYTATGGVLTVAAVLGGAALAVLTLLPKKLTAQVPAPLTLWVNPWSIFAIVSILALGILLYRLRRHGGAALWLFLTGAAPAICFGMLAIPETGLGDSAPEAGLRECLKHFPDHGKCTIAVERTFIAPVCWVTKRDDIVVVSVGRKDKDGKVTEGKLGELKYGIENHPEEYSAKHVTEQDFTNWRKGRKVLYVTFGKAKKRRMSEALSKPAETRTHGGVTIMRFDAEAR